MLTDKQIAAGWKPHDGGPCPVAPGLSIFPLYRRGGSTNSPHPAFMFEWRRVMDNCIIAYREAPSHD